MWIRSLSVVTLMVLMAGPMAAQRPSLPGDDGCIPDSVLFQGNPRWWYPGEPLQWARPGLIDSLIAANFDQWHLTVENPRSPGSRATIRYQVSPAGKRALFVPSDLRFISYDTETMTNASASKLVGHTYYSTSYWWDEKLHLQNGRTNWLYHAQRLYHSFKTNEIELSPTAPPPEGVEKAKVMAGDSASWFFLIEGDLELQRGPVDVYKLNHGKPNWIHQGHLNPTLKRWAPGNVHALKDYYVSSAISQIMVIRKHDLAFVLLPSPMTAAVVKLRKNRGPSKNNYVAYKGNVFFQREGSISGVRDIDSLVKDAEWAPLIVPGDPVDKGSFQVDSPSSRPWHQTLGLLLLSTTLGGALVWGSMASARRKAALPSTIGLSHDRLSADLRDLLSRGNTTLSSNQLDELIGLSHITSPETRRSRRARHIQLVNAESEARFGQPIIERRKSDIDKRMVNYHIVDLRT